MVTIKWRTLKDWQEHARTFHGPGAWEQAERFAYELGLSSNTLHIRREVTR